MSKWPAVEQVASHFVCNLWNFALSSKIQFQICCREEFDRWKIYRMDKICLELGTFTKFASGVLQTGAERCLFSCDHFYSNPW